MSRTTARTATIALFAAPFLAFGSPVLAQQAEAPAQAPTPRAPASAEARAPEPEPQLPLNETAKPS